MASTSTTSVRLAIRTRLLTFSPTVGSSLGTRLGGRLYWTRPPDQPSYPYGIIRLINAPTSWEWSGEKYAGQLEVEILGRPINMLPVVDGAADVVEEALLRWVESYADGTFIRCPEMITRDDVPQSADVADRQVVMTRQLFAVHWWAQRLTQYSRV